ncbi:hypothetical protein P3X46_034680 [Hevea brasiliensis]|uniref:FAF domain-containing protein n=1 Tax=Hevea brasiliensis TaxID=3981 RepID=A0ABQ9K8Z1_HEVBR|nr:uncharacterized protein LOC110661220 [Hevea brasiliensis]KAJ9128626.1 hypothetical protein P3X46_034680 [Hevea brasiliensis]
MKSQSTSSSSSSSSSASSSSSSWVHTKPTNSTPISDFSDLSLEETSLSSSFHFLDAQLSLSSLFSSSSFELNSLLAETDEKDDMYKKEEIHHLKNLSSGKPLTRGRLFPPPISCLKIFKTGRPYTYLSFNEEDDSFVLEEIRIPKSDIFRASREDGRLRLFFDHSGKEEEEEEEEEN